MMHWALLPLNGAWEVHPESLACRDMDGYDAVRAETLGWLPAQVPGEIHLDLMNAGLMPEPSMGNNAPQCRWPESKSWWYRTTFDVAAELLAHERLQLVFDGLDLSAQIFVNGCLACESADAFVPVVLDARSLLRTGRNELVVRLTSGTELAKDETLPGQHQPVRLRTTDVDDNIPNPVRQDNLYGHRFWSGKKWLRKPQFSYGWDWVESLPNIGIWRGVRIAAHSHAVLEDIRLDTIRRDGQVFLELEAVVENLHPWSERRCVLTVEIQPPDGGQTIRRAYDLDVPPGRLSVRDEIDIPDPRLWWPNGMGEQPLYHVIACVTDAVGVECDSRSFRIGLRTIEIDRTRLREGNRFCLKVNGHDVFCRGGNIGPHDIIPARIPDAKYEALVAEARDAHMNMLRINGCSFYESPAFYDACDRMGILIWHDFMLTCTTYPEDDAAFAAMVCAETEAITKLLRHHASIALWCGNNECTWGFRDWWNPNKDEPLDLGGQLFYNRLFPDICRRLDPHRPYWPGSPSGGDDPNGEIAGDCHWWGPFFMNEDVNRRIRHQVFDECRSRFVSEYGVIGPCHLDSIREYLAPEDMHPDHLAWRVHTNMFEKDTMPAAIRLHYSDPEGLSVPEYVLYGQLFQAMIHGNAMEALRFRKLDPQDDCQGALIWSYSDCWGETGWSILDYYLRRKASYYWFRRACAPVKVIVRQRGEQLVTRLVNDTLSAVKGTVVAGWWRLDGTDCEIESFAVNLAANGMLEVTTAVIPAATERDPREWLYAAVLRDAKNRPFDQSVWTFAPYRELVVSKPDITVQALDDGWYEISSPVYAHAVHVEDHGRAYLSDNWFDLLPGVPVRVRQEAETAAAVPDFVAVSGKPINTSLLKGTSNEAHA